MLNIDIKRMYVSLMYFEITFFMCEQHWSIKVIFAKSSQSQEITIVVTSKG